MPPRVRNLLSQYEQAAGAILFLNEEVTYGK